MSQVQHPRSALASTDLVTAALALSVAGGVYADGWAHLNVGGLDSFFTPWHALLYGAFTVLVAWIGAVIVRRHQAGHSGWRAAVPSGYGAGLLGIAVFAVGGFLDMLWHTAFGVEVGLDALVSPTHLLLLTGGALLLLTPFRSAVQRSAESSGSMSTAAASQPVVPWAAVLSLTATTALVGFFLSYLSVFADPGSVVPLTTIPEGAPGHRASELPAIVGLAGYVVFTVVIVAAWMFARRAGRLPRGGMVVLVAGLALSSAVLSEMTYLVPALLAIAGAALVDLLPIGMGVLAGAVLYPMGVWAGQLAGLALTGDLAWSVEMWAGVVGLSILVGVALAAASGAAGLAIKMDARALP